MRPGLLPASAPHWPRYPLMPLAGQLPSGRGLLGDPEAGPVATSSWSVSTGRLILPEFATLGTPAVPVSVRAAHARAGTPGHQDLKRFHSKPGVLGQPGPQTPWIDGLPTLLSSVGTGTMPTKGWPPQGHGLPCWPAWMWLPLPGKGTAVFPLLVLPLPTPRRRTAPCWPSEAPPQAAASAWRHLPGRGCPPLKTRSGTGSVGGSWHGAGRVAGGY